MTQSAAGGRIEVRPPAGLPARILGLQTRFLLMLPGLIMLAAVFFVPLLIMLQRSLTDPSPSNYVDLIQEPLYRRALLYTLWMSGLVTVCTLVVGYPYAYLMTQVRSNAMRAILAFVVLIPFWSSLLVRTYSWSIILQDTGLLNRLLQWLHVIREPIELTGNSRGVIVAMTHVLLPYMVLSLYANMRKIPDDLMPAARSLGAPRRRAFLHVFLPLSMPGVGLGCLLVFVLSIGFYITPAVLGGRTIFFSLLINTQVSKLLDFGFASAMAMALLLVVVALVALGARLLRGRDVTF